MSQVVQNLVPDQVLLVVRDFIANEQLFTALDVSNKVKETHPHARHREVRDVVRSLFHSEMTPSDYASTPITVSINGGTAQAEALLYHPLSDSWDLDSKYDAQKRAQVSAKPAQSGPTSVVSNGTTASVSDDGTVNVNVVKVLDDYGTVLPAVPTHVPASVAQVPAKVLDPSAVVPPTVPTPAAKVSAKDAWSSLFGTQPSLFPRRQ